MAVQLDDALDRGKATVAALDGALSADAALEAGWIEDWTALRGAAGEYANVRAAHLGLLNVQADRGLADDVKAHALFDGIAAAWPDLQRVTRFGTMDGGFRVASTEPFVVVDHTSREHFVAVVLNRPVLRRRIGMLEEAMASRTTAFRRDEERRVPGLKVGGPVSHCYGG